ncbi:MAG: CapA family protein [Acidobacteria bacterium]|nr:CapA family protein [Acidobacteriota bacterium]
MNRRTFLQQSTGALAGASIVPALTPAARATAQTTRTLSMAFTGDVILTRRISSLTDPAFLKVRALLSGADCTFGNCELVIADRHEGVPSAAGASLSSVVRPHIADEIRWLGFDVMGTANNHTLDYGVGGVSATRRHLDRVGIVAAGTGVNLQEAAAPRYVESSGGRIAVIGCASTVAAHAPAVLERGDYPGVPGTNTMRIVKKWQLPKAQLDAVKAAADALLPVQLTGAAFPVPPGVTFMGNAFVEGPTADVLSEPHPKDLKRIMDAIAVARPNARVVIVSIHAHEIYRDLTTPDPFVPTMARACIDAGADVFAVHGSHYMAGVELYKGKPIFYGLGDFFFQYHTFEALGADSYEAYGLEPLTTPPSQAVDKIPLRGGRQLWETIVPTLQWDGDRLTSFTVQPVTLGMDRPVHDRGTPVIASAADGERIVADLAKFSKRYGAEVSWNGDRGVVRLA